MEALLAREASFSRLARHAFPVSRPAWAAPSRRPPPGRLAEAFVLYKHNTRTFFSSPAVALRPQNAHVLAHRLNRASPPHDHQHPEARHHLSHHHHRLAGAEPGPPRRFSLHGFGLRGHSHLPGSPDRTEQICRSESMSIIARQPPERLRTQERRYGRPCCYPFPDSPLGSSAPAWLLRFWGATRGCSARCIGIPSRGLARTRCRCFNTPLLPFSPANR